MSEQAGNPRHSDGGAVTARQVGSPAGGRRTAAMFSSLGIAATNFPIRSRNRHLASRAVRRLGFAPIPGRRFNPQRTPATQSRPKEKAAAA